MLKINNLNMKYEDNIIIKDISFEIKEKEFISILGESGCGKTTLLNCMSRMLIPTNGEILFNGVDITKLNDKEVSNYRLNDIGYIFQDHNLIDCLNVEENIKLPLIINKKKNVNIEELLKIVMLEGFGKRDVNKLSGGQKQRVAIARALVNNPKIIFADEPTSSLNTAMAMEIKEIFKKIVETTNTTIVMVTHSEKMALDTRVIKLVDGVISNEI